MEYKKNLVLWERLLLKKNCILKKKTDFLWDRKSNTQI